MNFDNYQNYRNLGEYDNIDTETEEVAVEMQKFYITFGQDHVDHHGRSLRNCYTVIEAETEQEARDTMLFSPHYGNKNWSAIYKSAQAAGVIEYSMTFVPFSQL